MTEKDLEIRALRMRLKAYEDTGFKAKEIASAMRECAETIAENQFAIKEIRALGGMAHLWELNQAEKEGRLVVLPCKLHESIFYLEDGNWFEDIPYEVNFGERQGEWKDSLLFSCEDGFNFYEDDIDKTVFLTCEEAEAALKGDKHETDLV